VKIVPGPLNTGVVGPNCVVLMNLRSLVKSNGDVGFAPSLSPPWNEWSCVNTPPGVSRNTVPKFAVPPW